MTGDGGEPPMQFVFFVLCADIERRTRFRQRTEPILSSNVSNIFCQFDDALAGAALAGKQTGLIERHAVFDCPFAFRDWLVVPVRHIEPRERKFFCKKLRSWVSWCSLRWIAFGLPLLQVRMRIGEAECLRGLEVDYQLELGRLLHGWGRSSPHACAIKKSLSAGS